jgi:hypothetical protein
MPQVDPKAISIVVRMDDGTELIAAGDAARQIWEWYGVCEVMNCIHGARYTGPGYEVRSE